MKDMNTQKQTKKEPIIKGRVFATIVYEEHFNRDLIQSCGVKTLISPIHNRDVKEDGELKKAHYHVMFRYRDNTTLKNARTIAEKMKGVGCEKIDDEIIHARYFAHMDHPNKAQYSVSDYVWLNDYYLNLELKEKTIANDFDSIEGIIKNHRIQKNGRSYRILDIFQLLEVLDELEKTELKKYVRENTYYINCLLSCNAKRAQETHIRTVDQTYEEYQNLNACKREFEKVYKKFMVDNKLDADLLNLVAMMGELKYE